MFFFTESHGAAMTKPPDPIPSMASYGAQRGYQRPVPKEADFALDIFQRTFPEVTTEEGKSLGGHPWKNWKIRRKHGETLGS